MTNKIIFVNGDDTDFNNQVFLIVSYKTKLDLTGYKTRFTILNPTNLIKQYDVINNATEINLNKIITSTVSEGIHKCSVKLLDEKGRVKTVHNFEIEVVNEFDSTVPFINEYEIHIVLEADGIEKYKNYNELSNIPTINNVSLKGDLNFDDLGLTNHMISISHKDIDQHNTNTLSHPDIRDEIRNKQDRLIAGANITIIDGIISSLGAEGGVTTDYKDLGNKPKINGKVLDGDLSLDELKIQPKGEYVTENVLNAKGYLQSIPSGYLTEEELEAEGFLKQIPDTYFTDEQNLEKYALKTDLSLKQDVLTAGDNIEIADNTVTAIIPQNYVTDEKLAEQNLVNKEYLQSKLDKKSNLLYAGDNIRIAQNMDGTQVISAIDAKNPAEITRYTALSNKPTINGVELLGNKTAEDLKLQPAGEYQKPLKAGDNIEIVDDVIKAVMPDDMCTDVELQIGLSSKADKGESLNDYNIKDAYTKTEVDDLLKTNILDKLSDVLVSAPNGVASYTETTFIIKNGLRILFANGLKNSCCINKDITLDKDLSFNVANEDYNDNLKNFYLAIVYNNNVFTALLLPQNLFNIAKYETIPNTLSGYIKNTFDNKFYQMIYRDHGIYQPEQVLMKVLGQGTIVDNNGKVKITSFTPYACSNLINQDTLDITLAKYQKTLTFGDNFNVENNNVSYQIPYNYVTKEYLIENNFATQTNINDAVKNHNTSTVSHPDIREAISAINNRGYVTNTELNNTLQGYAEITDIPDARNYCTLAQYNTLLQKYNEQQQQIKDILEIIEGLHQ